ncbi:MAG: alpha/beta fold hydrolase [Thermodesulfovibrionales bacterium]
MEHSTSIRGLKIRYLEKGSGIPFVLLHGFSFCAETWIEIGLFDELAKGYHVYSFDMPYGIKSRSEKFDVKSRDEYVEFLKDLLKTLNINEPILLGASISGEVTLRYLSSGCSAKAGIVVGPVNVKTLIHQLSRVTVPLLGIWGERDDISSPDNSKILKENIKNTEVYILKDAGHACYLDKPEEFKEIVKDFLKRLSE